MSLTPIICDILKFIAPSIVEDELPCTFDCEEESSEETPPEE